MIESTTKKDSIHRTNRYPALEHTKLEALLEKILNIFQCFAELQVNVSIIAVKKIKIEIAHIAVTSKTPGPGAYD